MLHTIYIKALENNVINPLANRNMIRSSQATNMYNNLAEAMNDSISDYSAGLVGLCLSS